MKHLLKCNDTMVYLSVMILW